MEEGEGGAARGDEAIVVAPTTDDVGVEEDDVVGPPGWAEESVEPLPAEVTVGEGEGGDAASESSLESLPLGGEVSPWAVPVGGGGGLPPAVPGGPVPLSALLPVVEEAGPCSSPAEEGAEETSPISRGSLEEMPAPRSARGQTSSSAPAASPAVEEGEPALDGATGVAGDGWDVGSGGLPVWSCGWVATR